MSPRYSLDRSQGRPPEPVWTQPLLLPGTYYVTDWANRAKYRKEYNRVTKRNGVLVDKPKLVFNCTRNFQIFIEHKGPLPCSHESATGPSSARWIQSTPSHLISLRFVSVFFSNLNLGHQGGLVLSGFPAKTLYEFRFSSLRATCPVHLILLDFITVRSGDYEGPHSHYITV
jgi:hypothetical protein